MRDDLAEKKVTFLPDYPGSHRMRLFMHRVVHSVLTLIMFGLSVTFLDNHPTFLARPDIYRLMAALMSEHQWGMCCVGIATFGAFTSLAGGWRWRLSGAAVLAFGHAAIAAFIFGANPYGAGWIVFSGYAALGAALAYSTAHLGARTRESMAPSYFP